MELRHFRYFIAVAEELSFTRAARRLNMSQPPLSTHIRDMEATLGTRLFDRSRGHVVLTEAGRVLLDEARKVIEQAEHAVAATRKAGLGEGGTLKLGYGAWAPHTPIFAATLLAFRKKHPGIELSLEVLHTSETIEATLRGEIQVGLVRPHADMPIPDDLARLTISEDRLMLVLPTGHPLASRPEPLALADLAGCAFVLGATDSGLGIYRQVSDAFRADGVAPDVVQRSGDSDTILALIGNGLGVGILPECLRGSERTPLVWKALRSSVPMTSRMLALIHARRCDSPQRAQFLAALRDTAASLDVRPAPTPAARGRKRGDRLDE